MLTACPLKNLTLFAYVENNTSELPPEIAALLFRLPNLIELQIDPWSEICPKFVEVIKAKTKEPSKEGTARPIDELQHPSRPHSQLPQTYNTVPTTGTATISSLSSIQILVLNDAGWEFLCQLCPNLQQLSIGKDRSWKAKEIPLDIEKLGKICPNIRALTWHKICEREVLQGQLLVGCFIGAKTNFA
jgi:hypothetical protein